MKTIQQMLEMMQNEELKTKLLKVYKDTKEKMLEMPASTKYHHAYVGGYHDHVQQVMYYGMRVYKIMDKTAKVTCTLDDVIMATFIHDLDKLERYVLAGEIKTGENAGKPKFAHAHDWTIDPYAKVCTMLAKWGILLNDDHIHALAYQAGGWSEFVKYGSDLSHLATILHTADMLSAKILTVKENIKEEEGEGG